MWGYVFGQNHLPPFRGGKTTKQKFLIASFLIFLVGGVYSPTVLSAAVPKITKDELDSLLGNPDLIILDVRRNSHWTSSDLKLKGANREDPNDIEGWADKYSRDKTIVLYCA